MSGVPRQPGLRKCRALALNSLMLLAGSCPAALPLIEPFADARASGGTAYAAGAPLAGQTNAAGDRWFSVNAGAGSMAPTLTSLPLAYPGLPPPTGNAVSLRNVNGPGAALFLASDTQLFFQPTNNATVYYSLRLQLPNLTSLSNAYYNIGFATFPSIGDQGGQAGIQGARLYFNKIDATNYQVGIAKNSAAVAYDPTPYSTNDVLFIVAGYEIIYNAASPSTVDDNVRLWVNPPVETLGADTRPPETVAIIGSTADAGGPLSALVLLQRSSAGPGLMVVDELRVGTHWAFVSGGAPEVTVRPGVTNLNYGSTLTLTAEASGPGLLGAAFQWQRGGTNLVDDSRISGATTSNLQITNVSALDAGVYSVVAFTASNRATNSASVTVTDPVILSQPRDVPFAFASTVRLTVGAVGSPPLTYQWRVNGTNLTDGGRIRGATSNVLAIANAQGIDSGTYTVVVTSGAGSLTSAPAALLPYETPDPPPGGPLVEGEFFWDTDPGQGNGIPVVFPSAETVLLGPGSLPLEVDVSSLSAGLHRLGLRMRDAEERWGEVAWLPMDIKATATLIADVTDWPPAETNQWLAAAEYFWDVDPGPGLGTSTNLPLGQTVIPNALNSPLLLADFSSVSPGIRQLGVRVRDTAGRWGQPSWIPIEVKDVNSIIGEVTDWPPVQTNHWLAAAEYFWDTDPGPGLGTGTNVPAGQTLVADGESPPWLSVDVAPVSAGLHQLGYRVRDVSGRWGPPAYIPVEVKETAALIADVTAWPPAETNQLLVAAEYFWDTDPGTNRGAFVPLVPVETATFGPEPRATLNIPVPRLSLGLHQLGYRVKDAQGFWSAAQWLGVILDRKTDFNLATAITVLVRTNTNDVVIADIPCPGTGQTCSNLFELPVATESVLNVHFTSASSNCSDFRIRFAVDDTERAVSGRLAAGASSGWLALGPVSAGTHRLQLQAEGFLGGCNIGTLSSWAGALQVVTTSLATNVAGGEFTHRTNTGSGLALGDFNRDGYADLFLATEGPGTLFVNDRNGALDRTALPPSLEATNAQAAAWTDVDNDGALDLFAATPERSLLFQNLGGTNFLTVTPTNLPATEGAPSASAWADLDGDGFVDLVLGWTNWSRLELYRSLGDGTFLPVAASSNLVAEGVRSVAFGDVDNDGRPDLVSVGADGLRLFRNFGTNQLVELMGTGLPSDPTATGLAWADYDSDGWLDLFVGSGDHLGALFRNNQDYTFTQVQISTFNVPGFQTASFTWEDFDQDGRLDLFVASGRTDLASRFFRNRPDGTLVLLTNNALLLPAGAYAGNGWADMNRDGRPDLLVAARGGTNVLAVNAGSGAGWLRVRVAGRPSNKAAIGARVKVLANIDGESFWQLRQISSGSGSPGELPITFGLGDAPIVQSLRIEWPSGLETIYTNLPINQTLVVSELPDGQPVVTINQEFRPSGQYSFVSLDPVEVSIDSPFQNGWVFYTTDGSDPDFTDNWYTGPFLLSPPATIRTIAYDENLTEQVFGDPAELLLVPTFFLTNSTPGGGLVEFAPPGPNYLSNTMVTATAVHGPGWTFQGWAGDVSGTNPVATLVMDRHVDLRAIFATPLAVTTLGGAGFGTAAVEPPQAFHAYGAVPRLIARPAPGRYFVRWSLAGSTLTNLTSNTLDWPMTNSEPSFIALFANLPTNTFSLTILLNGRGSVSRSPAAGYYTNGEPVVLTATPPFAQFFLGWSGDVTSPQNPVTVTMDSSKVITANFGLKPPLFSFGAADYETSETSGAVELSIRNNGVPGTVEFATVNGSAVGGLAGTGTDFVVTNGTVAFAYGETNKTVSIRINNRYLRDRDKSFQVQLSNPTGGSTSLTNPAAATVVIHYDTPLNTTNSLLVQAAPGPVPDRSGSLRVNLVPPVPEVEGGLWRFPWELAWRPAGQLVTNLSEDYYPIEFRQLPGYQVASVPPQLVFTNASATEVTNEYFVIGATAVGRLTVHIGPNNPIVTTNAGWRLLGEEFWRPTGATATNVAPGTQVVEFRPVTGLSAPPAREVAVFGNQESSITSYYELPVTLPPDAALPLPLASLEVINQSFTQRPRMPFTFNGQVQTDFGSGSGVAALSNVVLTAAHVVFNDVTLSYAGEAAWFFQKHTGELDPKPQMARGYYLLSGYAAARTNDLPPAGNLSPGLSSPQSRTLDVAALYFLSPAARGGFGGYLASDAPVNEWLTGNQPKLLVGYPLDGTQFSYTNVQKGRMHSTLARNFRFTLQANRVYATEDFLNFPGNSGGPLYVLCTNDIFYPAAVYLGTVGNASVVRSIDVDVVTLLNLAQLSATFGDAGTNFTGGGVLRIVSSGPVSNSVGYLQVRIGPPAAIAAGGGWRLATSTNSSGNTSFSSNPNFTATIMGNTNFLIEFAPAPGWNLPVDQTVAVPPGQLTIIDATYSVVPPQMTLGPSGLGFTGTTNTRYRIEYRTNLAAGTWQPLRTNSLGTGFNLVLPWPLTNGPRAFYRALWLP